MTMSKLRKNKRIRENVNNLHKDLVLSLLKVIQWEANENQFSKESKEKIKQIKERWNRYCAGRNFGEVSKRSISNICKLIEAYFLLDTKYGATTDKGTLQHFLMQDMTQTAEDLCIKVIVNNQYVLP